MSSLTPAGLARSRSDEEARGPECTTAPGNDGAHAHTKAADDGKAERMTIASNQDEESEDVDAISAATGSGTSLKQVLKKLQANEEMIRELDLTEMSEKYLRKVKASGGVLIARVMEINRTVERLVLPDHDIGDRGALAMADMLRMNSTLRHLDLNGNGITDIGCKGVADSLYGHDSLQHLALWGNAIGDEGAKAIAQALQVNRSLTYVGLVGNRIGEEGAKALLEAVQMNPMIQSLGLAANPIPSDIQNELNVALAANKAAAMTMTNESDDEEFQNRSTIFPVIPVSVPALEDREAATLYDSDASDSSTDEEEARVAEDDDDDDACWV